jgi:DNA-binding transcriptional LysR family regulator
MRRHIDNAGTAWLHGAVNTDNLRAFVAVARAGRFTRAAKTLGVSQPSLSRRVQQLETDLGAKLVIRTPGGVVLTSAGERFLRHAELALAAITAGMTELDDLSGKPRGTVALGSTPTVGAYVLPDVMARYRERHPDVTVRLGEGLPAELEEQVASGALDLAVLNLPVRRVELSAQKLWQEDYVLAVAQGHRLSTLRRPIALVEAAGEPFVVVPGVPATEALLAACEERGVPPVVALEADNLESVRRMVERGIGVALLPRIMAGGDGQAFVAIEVSRGGLRRQVALVHRGEGYLTAAARALRDLLVEMLRASPRRARA